MESILIALIRCALTDNSNSAIRHQINRLHNYYTDTSNIKMADAINSLLNPNEDQPEFKIVQSQPKGAVWIKVEDGVPSHSKPVFCENAKGVKYAAFYTKGGEIEIDFEDDDNLPDWVIPHPENECYKLKEGWYEECDNSGYYDRVTYKRKIVRWLDESTSRISKTEI